MDKFNGTLGKFRDPKFTANGASRAHVKLKSLDTLWFNTGTLCNLECVNCYIESSPKNDALVYISHAEVLQYLNEIRDNDIAVKEIGLTGGEPFMNPDIIEIITSSLEYGFNVLVLTNAMKPMMRHQDALLELQGIYGDKLSVRVSMDHFKKDIHQTERGDRSWDPMIAGLKWLSESGFDLHVAGRTFTHEDEDVIRSGFEALFKDINVNVDAKDPHSLILFPEMGEQEDVVEITTECWGILNIDPGTMMCASSRMIVKHKGAKTPAIMACTLLAFDEQFNMGDKLVSSQDTVSLNHPFCSTFCVLGGASCSN